MKASRIVALGLVSAITFMIVFQSMPQQLLFAEFNAAESFQLMSDYCYKHADRAARGDNPIEDLKKINLIPQNWNWDCASLFKFNTDDEKQLSNISQKAKQLLDSLESALTP